MVWFNFFPDKVGILVSFDDPSSFVPLLSPGFHRHLPWLNLWWTLALILNLAHLYYGRWRPLTRWADIGLNSIALIVLLRLILGGALVEPTRATSQLGSPQSLVPVIDIVVKGGMAIVLVTLVVEMGRKLIRLLEGRPADA
jgi:hypothetical protein